MQGKEIGVGVIGAGIIAGQTVKMLAEREQKFSEEAGCPLVLKRVKVLKNDMERTLVKQLGEKYFTTDDDDFFNTDDIDIIVEAIGGEHPALEYLSRAISSGRHVVTSNKEVIAKHLEELTSLAEKNNVSLRCEASVGGGIPLLLPMQFGLNANEVQGIYAIINGTTNYILTRMASNGMNFADALKEAQQKGYAEADPTNDIEGKDSVYKLAIISSMVFGTSVKPEQIYREGISKLEEKDFRYAKELGYAIKLLAISKQVNGQIEVRVHPVFVDEESMLAKVDGVYNAVLVKGDLVGETTFIGEGAGAEPTSSAVISDIISAAQDIRLGVGNRGQWDLGKQKPVKEMKDILSRYYMRLNIADSAGVLAKVAEALGENGLSISSAIQKETDEESKTAEIVIMTHGAKEEAMQKALKTLEGFSEVNKIDNVIRVEE